jgi:hypothetical protein
MGVTLEMLLTGDITHVLGILEVDKPITTEVTFCLKSGFSITGLGAIALTADTIEALPEVGGFSTVSITDFGIIKASEYLVNCGKLFLTGDCGSIMGNGLKFD